MNLITCGALLCLHIEWISNDKRVVFFACFVFAVAGIAVATCFKKEVKKEAEDSAVTSGATDFEKEGLLSESA